MIQAYRSHFYVGLVLFKIILKKNLIKYLENVKRCIIFDSSKQQHHDNYQKHTY
jgi:hypothetical protein